MIKIRQGTKYCSVYELESQKKTYDRDALVALIPILPPPPPPPITNHLRLARASASSTGILFMYDLLNMWILYEY